MLEEYLKLKGLTKAEIAVFKLRIAGLSIRDMGKKLFVAEKTIKFHITRIRRKLGPRTGHQILVELLLEGVITLDEIKASVGKTESLQEALALSQIVQLPRTSLDLNK